MNKILRHSLLVLIALFTSNAFAGTVTFTAGTDKGSDGGTAADNVTLTKDGITITVSNGILGRTDNYRVYKGQTITFNSTVGNITSVVFTCTANGSAKYGPGNFTDATAGSYTFESEGKTGTWTGDAASFTLTASSNQVRATEIVVNYTDEGGNSGVTTVTAPTISGEETFTESATVTITAAEGATIYYTLDGTEPSDQGDEYTDPISLTATTTVKAVAYDAQNNKSEVTEKTFTKIVDVKTVGDGTEVNPYTASDAKALSDADQLPADEAYYTGTVTSTEFSAQYGNNTYYLTDGTNQLEVFRGLYFDGAKFTSDEQLQKDDNVVVKGKLTLYKGNTLELAQGSSIISINGSKTPETVKTDTLSYTASEALAVLSAGTQTTDPVYVSGIVSKVDTTGVGKYGNILYYISDDGTEANQLEVYRAYSFNGEKFTADNVLKVGDKVKLVGVLKNYTKGDVTTPEVDSGSKIVELNGQTANVNGIKAETATKDSQAYNIAGQKVGKTFKGIVIKKGKKYIQK